MFYGIVLGSTILMACTLAELEQQSSRTTFPRHYAPSDWHLEIVPVPVDLQREEANPTRILRHPEMDQLQLVSAS
ncbi:hypothetical protein QTP70_003280 [Hemibagrus guttatus]|uniref:Secreted protein n=1 Tax=Hemibagrus guttatus TaxID=175788 RepID=A0AAE0UPE9_9TELE|nr:hypothetical protein QTP70_003280 [Hemibagrus guttatus]